MNDRPVYSEGYVVVAVVVQVIRTGDCARCSVRLWTTIVYLVCVRFDVLRSNGSCCSHRQALKNDVFVFCKERKYFAMLLL